MKIKVEDRSIQLKYYYKTSQKQRLQKVQCDICKRIVSLGNFNQHKTSTVHIAAVEKLEKTSK
jgi:hypothetical protein